MINLSVSDKNGRYGLRFLHKTGMFNAFVDLEPVQRSEDGCDMRRFRSFDHSACKTVLNSVEGDLFQTLED